MSQLKIFVQLLMLLSLFHAKMLTVRNTYDPGSCSKSNHGELILVKDRENRDTILVCTENNGIYYWKTTDNSKPPGEYFNSGYDCLDILSKNTKAKDGYYWVDFSRGTPKKVYCDMTTDGGGYMLFGRMNDTVTWGIPSNNKTVKPFGHPHWSSEFGDVSVLDMRIQISSDDHFENTRAHWSFRFKNRRVLKDLMIVNKGGCPYNFPGVGDVSYVKDLMTAEIVSKDFSCSIFGAYSHPIAKIGWTMMNLCLEKPCPNGFAYHQVYPIQVDFSGGFSYVVTANDSTSTTGATAFFGCDKGKCCACYGPIGGKGIYCRKECQATNGGTVTKHASAWFWVRLNPPRKVWEKCMEYKSEEENGDSAWYKLVGDRNIPVRGRCGRSESHINDGVVVVEDGSSFQEIPTITGLLAYRKDNQSLHVRSNDTWKVLTDDKKMKAQLAKIETYVKRQVSKIDEQLATVTKLIDVISHGAGGCKLLVKQNPHLSSGTFFIGNSRVYCEMPSGWNLVARFSNNDGKNWMKDAKFWFDKMSADGLTLDPSYNQDMISEGFWRTAANEIKITRSDDATHTALLETTGNCLNGKTFREFITSFGDFRNRATWASDKCLGNCIVKYGGQYQSTSGFEKYGCSSDIQSRNYIGFWCDWDGGDGAVMMIGGGGSGCHRADHGIGITEDDNAKFGGGSGFLDFGYNPLQGPIDMNSVQKLYALNLWIR